MSGRLRAFLVPAVVIAFAILATLLAAEAVVRMLGVEPHAKMRVVPGRGITFEPGAAYRYVKEGFSEGRFNREGFRDRERSVLKPPGVFRILVLGDSFVEALQVPLDDAFPALLEDALRHRTGSDAIEVVAMGQSGFGTASELMRWREFGAAYDPDLVLLAFYAGNDVRDDSRRLSGGAPAFYFTLDAGGGLRLDRCGLLALERSRAQGGLTAWLLEHSRLAGLVSDRLDLLRLGRRRAVQEARLAAVSGVGGGLTAGLPEPDDRNVYLENPSPVWEEAWRVTDALIGRLAEEVAAHGARFALVSVGTPEQVEDDLGRTMLQALPAGVDLERPDRRLRAICDAREIPCLFLAPHLHAVEASSGARLYGFGERRGGHWNAAGHRAAAQAIEAFLLERRLWTPPSPEK
jgi:lysophospholipase L1-like esterase